MSQRSKIHTSDLKHRNRNGKKRGHQKVEPKNTTDTLKAAQKIKLKNRTIEAQKFAVKS